MDGFQVRGLGAVEMVFIEVLRFGGEVLEVRRFEGSRERGKERFEGMEFEVRRFVKAVFEEGEVRRGKERCSTGSRR
jgi:hypothetical protein